MIVIKRMMQCKVKYYYFYYCDFFLNPKYLRLMFWLNMLVLDTVMKILELENTR